MKVRCVKFAFVSAAFLAALATSCGTAYASPASENAELARQAYTALQQGDAQSAISQFTGAIESRSLEQEVLANALLNRALAFQQTNDHGSAIDDYTAALSLDAMSPSLRATALYNRGLSQQKLGKLPLAIEDFTGSLLLNPKSAYAFYSRANALRESGQLLFALSDYERALRYQHPDQARVYFGSATTYLALERPQDAKRAFNAALAANPNYGEARAQLVLLGDENASAKQLIAEVDPILTGTVSAISGGTVATKPDLPRAVEPPNALLVAAAPTGEIGDVETASTTPLKQKKKKIVERVPEQDGDFTLSETATPKAVEQVVAIEQVPEIPEPTTAAAEVPADEIQTAAIEQPVEEKIDTTPSATSSAWAVQLASAASENAAWSTWEKLQARHKVLQSEKPVVVKADLGAKGIFYRVRLGGFDDQNSAKSACSKLKSKGVKCYISKTES